MKSKLPAPSAGYYRALRRRYERVRHFKTNKVLWSQFGEAEKRIMQRVIHVCYEDCFNEGIEKELSMFP